MDGSPDAQADFQAILDGLIINYVFLSVIVFYGYDILLKMSSEVGFIWGGPKKPRITVSLYITTRYCPLFFVIIQFTPVPSDMKTCNRIADVESVSIIVTRICTIVVLNVQVWALYNRDRRIICVLAIIGIAVVFFDVYADVGSTCLTIDIQREELSMIFQAVFAACIMVLSIWKVTRIVNWRESVRSFGVKTRFKYTQLAVSESLRRITICVLMILQTLFTRLAPVDIDTFAIPFMLPLEAILVCRLMLDLHKAAQEDRNPTITYIFSAVEVSDNPVDISGSEDVANELQSGSITLNAIT